MLFDFATNAGPFLPLSDNRENISCGIVVARHLLDSNRLAVETIGFVFYMRRIGSRLHVVVKFSTQVAHYSSIVVESV